MKTKTNAFSGFFQDLFTWKGIKKQKWGWFTAFFYAVGNVFWSIASAFEAVILKDRAVASGHSVRTIDRIAGGFWISLTRELFYLIALLVLWGIRKPHALKKLKHTFSVGGSWMFLAVAANFIGNVSVVVGLVLLGSNASISSVLENSFIAITFFATFLTFKQKFEWKTFAGVLVVMGLILGIFFVQTKGWSSSDQKNAFIGMALVFAGNFGYMVKNMVAEYVYKNKYLDGETVQLFATFYSFFVGMIIAPIFLTIVQPMIEHTVSGDPYKYIGYLWTDSHSMMIVFVIIASFFLLTGRNCQYANTLVSGASLSNVFYQAKNLLIAVVNIPLYAIMAAFFGGVYPFNYDPSKGPGGYNGSFSSAITHGGYEHWFYWVLLVALFFAIAYTVLSGQEKFEETHAEYRVKKGLDPIEDDALGKGLLDNKAALRVKAKMTKKNIKTQSVEIKKQLKHENHDVVKKVKTQNHTAMKTLKNETHTAKKSVKAKVQADKKNIKAKKAAPKAKPKAKTTPKSKK